MQDSTVPMTKVAAMTAWVVTFALLAGSWVAALTEMRWGLVLGQTAIVSAVVAGALQTRCWAVRVAALVRAFGRAESSDRSDLHSIR